MSTYKAFSEPRRYTATVSGHWATFFGDVRAAFRVWRRFPILPAVSVGIFVISTGFRSGWAALLSFLVLLFMAGWVGTERMFYLRGFRGKPMAVGEALRFTRAYIGRYMWLGIVTMLPLIAIYIVIAAVSDAPPFGDAGGTQWAPLVINMVALIIWDVALTFVTPALAFTTPVVGKAWGIGIKMLRDGWPGTAWYALLPPLAFVALSYTRPPESATEPIWMVATVASMFLNLLAKGATAAFYLRHSEVGDDGAAFTDYLSPKKEKEPAEAGS